MGQSRSRAMLNLRMAQAKFTRAKSEHDGSDLAEVRYQKAKRALAAARDTARLFPPVVKPGDAVAKPEPLHGSTTIEKE